MSSRESCAVVSELSDELSLVAASVADVVLSEDFSVDAFVAALDELLPDEPEALEALLDELPELSDEPEELLLDALLLESELDELLEALEVLLDELLSSLFFTRSEKL